MRRILDEAYFSGLYMRRIFERSLTSNDVRNVQEFALYGSFQPSTQAAEAEIQLENFRTFEVEAGTGNSYVFVYSKPRQNAFERSNQSSTSTRALVSPT